MKHTPSNHYYKQNFAFYIHSIKDIIDHIHHLMNEFRIQSFTYNSDRKVYMFSFITICA